MRNTKKRQLTFLIFLIMAFGCNKTSNSNDSVLWKVIPQKNKPLKTISFEDKSGKKINTYFYDDPERTDGRKVVFNPTLTKTEDELRNASLNVLRNIKGYENETNLKDSKTEDESNPKGVTTCWNLSNSNQKFCVLPVKESDLNEIRTMHVWLK